MSLLSEAADSLADGDLVDKLIRKEGRWNLLPAEVSYSIPQKYLFGIIKLIIFTFSLYVSYIVDT